MAAMHAHIVMTSDDTLLSALRRTLQDAEESLLCVAFVSMEGVHLIERELKNTPASLLATTVFGSTKPAALNRVLELGSSVRTLNPSPGTYHPKVYLGRRGDRLSALIGSSNLTGGLVVNVEAATWIEGRVTDPQLSRLWGWARGLWENPRAEQWQPKTLSADEQPVITGELHRLLELEAERDPVFLTLGRSSRPNRIRLTRSGVYVETNRTDSRGIGAQFIPASMLNIAWEYLKAHGRLENRVLLNELRVHRSSAVCAMLARLPSVRRATGRVIALEWIAG